MACCCGNISVCGGVCNLPESLRLDISIGDFTGVIRGVNTSLPYPRIEATDWADFFGSYILGRSSDTSRPASPFSNLLAGEVVYWYRDSRVAIDILWWCDEYPPQIRRDNFGLGSYNRLWEYRPCDGVGLFALDPSLGDGRAFIASQGWNLSDTPALCVRFSLSQYPSPYLKDVPDELSGTYSNTGPSASFSFNAYYSGPPNIRGVCAGDSFGTHSVSTVGTLNSIWITPPSTLFAGVAETWSLSAQISVP